MVNSDSRFKWRILQFNFKVKIRYFSCEGDTEIYIVTSVTINHISSVLLFLVLSGFSLFLWVGREPHSPYCLVQNKDLGQKVTPFIKPASRSISFIIRAFPGSRQIFLIQYRATSQWFHILLYRLLKWSLIIHSSLDPCHIRLFVRGWVIMNIN